MSYFLKRVADSKRRVLDRAVAIAAAGASVTARVPFPLQDSQVLHDLLPRHLPYFDQAGILGLSWYRVSPVPSSDISKETSGAVGSKSSDYFGRHTVGPAVVNIAGSGTIINKDGTILTCAHVVARGTRRSKRKVEVTLQDGRTYEGKVVNVDMHSYIAILKINSETPLPEAKLGSSSTLRPGDLVIAMGCPHSLQNTVTAGIVSCVDGKSSDLGFSGTPREYLQTDCAVNVGNSGGPLVNIDGEVMAADGLSFSVPIDSVSKIVEHFKKSGRVVRPWLQHLVLNEMIITQPKKKDRVVRPWLQHPVLRVRPWLQHPVLRVRPWLQHPVLSVRPWLQHPVLSEMIIAQPKKKDASFPNVDKGILVPMVMPGFPGDRAWFRPGDVVVEFDGKPVESMNEVIERMGDKVGVPMKVLVKRGSDKLVTLTVIPEEVNLDV